MYNKDKAKRKIQKAFLELIKSMPVDAIQVKELCRLAGISRSTFYVYYDSVWDILQEIEDEFFGSAFQIKTSPAYDPVETENIPNKMIDYLQEQKDVIGALGGNTGDYSYFAKWTKAMNLQLEQWHQGPFDESDPTAILLREFIIGGAQRMLLYWNSHIDTFSSEDMKKAMKIIIEHAPQMFKQSQ